MHCRATCDRERRVSDRDPSRGDPLPAASFHRSRDETMSTEAKMAVDFVVEEKLGSFSELQTKTADYCNANFIQLLLRGARTIVASAKHVPKRAAVGVVW